MVSAGLVASTSCFGQQVDSAVEMKHTHKFGAECGIYSLAIAANSIGAEIELGRLLKSEYVPTLKGSSAQNLIDAANSTGLFATALKAMNTDTLRACQFPLLLNMRSDRTSECTGHWVAYLGEDNSEAIIFDPAKDSAPQRVPFSHLSIRWTGAAVAISNTKTTWPDKLWLRFCSTSSFLFLFGLSLSGIVALRRLKHSSLAILSFAAIPFAIVLFQSLSADSLIRNREVASFLESKYSTTDDFERVDASSLMSELNAMDVLVIDARFPDAFEFGHIPTAVNLPIDSKISELSAFASKYSHDQKIVVYCLNPKCTWATTIAKRLKARGFTNLWVFEAGLQGFNEHISRKSVRGRRN